MIRGKDSFKVQPKSAIMRQKFNESMQTLFGSFFLIRSASSTDLFYLYLRTKMTVNSSENFLHLMHELLTIVMHDRVALNYYTPMIDDKEMTPILFMRNLAGNKGENVVLEMVSIDEATPLYDFVEPKDFVEVQKLIEEGYQKAWDNSIKVQSARQGTFMDRMKSMNDEQFMLEMQNVNLKQQYWIQCNRSFDKALHSSQSYIKQHQRQAFDTCCQQSFRDATLQKYDSRMWDEYLRFLTSSRNVKVSHPRMWYAVATNSYKFSKAGVIDLIDMPLDYIFQVMSTAHWMKQVCFAKKSFVSSNSAVLLLYGNAGTGKSTIAKAISDVVDGFLWGKDRPFQSSVIISAPLIIVEECKLESLTASIMKELCDFQSDVTIDLKNKDAVAISYQCPVIITSNDDIGLLEDWYDERRKNLEDFRAAKRRLYPVPFYNKCNQSSMPTNNEIEFRRKLFSTLLAMVLYGEQQHLEDPPQEILQLLYDLAALFEETRFGQWYSRNGYQTDLTNRLFNPIDLYNREEVAPKQKFAGINKRVMELWCDSKIDMRGNFSNYIYYPNGDDDIIQSRNDGLVRRGSAHSGDSVSPVPQKKGYLHCRKRLDFTKEEQERPALQGVAVANRKSSKRDVSQVYRKRSRSRDSGLEDSSDSEEDKERLAIKKRRSSARQQDNEKANDTE